MKTNYYPRIVDDILKLKLEIFGAIHVVGPKWCGKTTTAEHNAKSSLKLQAFADKESLIQTAKIMPQVLLEGPKPRLIDEWQDAPELWDAIRVYCDDTNKKGLFILTGSTSKKVLTSHTGTGRISKLKMYPMSLYESKESNGLVSLKDLFDNNCLLDKGVISDLSMDDLIFASCRGGWPGCLSIKNKLAQLEVAKDYFNQIYESDMFSIDNVKRNSNTMRAVLHSYARNISTLANRHSLLEDIMATNNITLPTLDDYIDILERLYIVEDLYGWCPNIRSASAIRSGRKREFVDSSLVVASLGASPSLLRKDLKTFGFIFENLVIRDLKIYSTKLNGHLSYYHDKYDLECDAVLHLDDGRYALIEIKLGANGIDLGAKSLNKIEELIIKKNQDSKTKIKLRLPDLKIIITGEKYGYKRDDGIYVIPIGCLKD